MLIFENISYQYPNSSTPALSDVSFAIAPGRCVALMGANGSGKSTLARLANGLLDIQAGRVVLTSTPENAQCCLPTTSHAVLRQLRSNVAVVTQNPDLQILATTVEQDVAFGPENLGVEPTQIARRVADALAAVGLSGYELRDPHTLSGGEKQRLVIAGALAMNPTYLVLDEPTSMLDGTGRREVHAIIRQLRQQGHGILLITHNLSEVRLADDIVLLDEGQVAANFSAAELDVKRGLLVDLGVAMPMNAGERSVCLSGVGDVSGQPRLAPTKIAGAALRAQQISYGYDDGSGKRQPALRDVDLTLRNGQLTLITGSTGAGKSTLLRLLAGLLKPSRGTICLNPNGNPTAPEPGQVGLVFQEPANQLFAQSVAEDVAFGPVNLGLAKTDGQRREIVSRALTSVGLDYEQYAHLNPLNLSGGQARRVAIAGVLALGTQVVLFDEPTAGLDARGIMQLLNLIRGLLDEGRAVAVVTHDAEVFQPLASESLQLPTLTDAGPALSATDRPLAPPTSTVSGAVQ